MATVVKEARYILTNIENNNNKFWNISLYDDGCCETRWGRVGETGQSKAFPGAGEHLFDSKRREKENRGYREARTLGNAPNANIETHRLADVAVRQIDTNSPETMDLVGYLARVNVHSILQSTTLQFDTSRGTFSTPLGIVTADAIASARGLLTEIADYVLAEDYDNSALIPKLNDYLMLVPQNIGRGKPDPRKLYPDLEAIRSQNSILDSLEASLQMALSTPKEAVAAPEPRLFETRLHRVDDEETVRSIRQTYYATYQTMHACAHLDVKRVFSVEIASMRRAFEEEGCKVGNIRSLWHGTKASNLLSILKGGFTIPPSNAPHVTGRMFGNGVYFSDQSTKSLNYAYGYWGGERENNCFMLMCDVAMGREFVPTGPFSVVPTLLPSLLPFPGFNSTFARAGKSGVVNNEMIVYRTCQINPRYLVEFSPQGK